MSHEDFSDGEIAEAWRGLHAEFEAALTLAHAELVKVRGEILREPIRANET